MKMNLLKKIITFVMILLLSFIVVSCENGDGPGNGSTPTVNLPEAIVQKEKDEIIYVNLSEEGQIDSIKVTNRIKDSSFAYYEDYGMFLNYGNLNVTSGKGPIIVKDDKALIPSLQENNNMFYTLNLNKAYYESLLPFSITMSYKLNNKKVSYTELKGATGEITLNFEFKQNPEAQPYFLENYAAQVQIPINIDKADIISAEGAMQQVLVGKTLTLAYMVMPGSNTNIEIVLDANNFSFEGLQASIQPFAMSSMLDFLPIDIADSFDLQSMPLELDALLALLSLADNSLSQVFNELLPGLSTIKDELSGFEQLEDLVDGLNNTLLTSSLNSLTINATYKPAHSSKKEIFIALIDKINQAKEIINDNYSLIDKALNKFMQTDFDIVPLVAEYQDLYTLFADIIEEFSSIRDNLGEIAKYGDLDLKVILNQKAEFSQLFKDIGASSDTIKENLQSLIMGMYLLPNKLEPLMSVLIQAVEPISHIFAEIAKLKDYFIDVANNIQLGLDEDWFLLALIPRSLLTSLTKEVEIGKDGPAETPGLIQGLTIALESAEGIEQLDQVTELYKVNPLTSLRQIDMIPYTFIQINEGLTVKQEDKPLSFFEGMDLIKQLPSILELLPASSIYELPSFLSEFNLPPTTVQFVYKQRGF